MGQGSGSATFKYKYGVHRTTYTVHRGVDEGLIKPTYCKLEGSRFCFSVLVLLSATGSLPLQLRRIAKSTLNNLCGHGNGQGIQEGSHGVGEGKSACSARLGSLVACLENEQHADINGLTQRKTREVTEVKFRKRSGWERAELGARAGSSGGLGSVWQRSASSSSLEPAAVADHRCRLPPLKAIRGHRSGPSFRTIHGRPGTPRAMHPSQLPSSPSSRDGGPKSNGATRTQPSSKLFLVLAHALVIFLLHFSSHSGGSVCPSSSRCARSSRRRPSPELEALLAACCGWPSFLGALFCFLWLCSILRPALRNLPPPSHKVCAPGCLLAVAPLLSLQARPVRSARGSSAASRNNRSSHASHRWSREIDSSPLSARCA
jgi:hypothetical protein